MELTYANTRLTQVQYIDFLPKHMSLGVNLRYLVANKIKLNRKQRGSRT